MDIYLMVLEPTLMFGKGSDCGFFTFTGQMRSRLNQIPMKGTCNRLEDGSQVAVHEGQKPEELGGSRVSRESEVEARPRLYFRGA